MRKTTLLKIALHMRDTLCIQGLNTAVIFARLMTLIMQGQSPSSVGALFGEALDHVIFKIISPILHCGWKRVALLQARLTFG